MHYHFVINPVAGRRSPVDLVRAIAEILRAEGHEVSSHVTTGAGCAGRHVAGLDDGEVDRLVAVGGDGTLRELINGRDPLPWPVGSIPMGTANLVGRELRMPLDHHAGHLAAALLRAEPWRVDTIAIARDDGPDELALANVGAGLDGELVHTIAELRRADDGGGGYGRWVRPMWNNLVNFDFPQLNVTVDGQRTYAAGAVVVQNAYNYGGIFELSPRAALDSGTLDIMLIRARTNRDLFRILFSSWVRRIEQQKDVQFVRGRTVRIEAGRGVRLQADGDPAGRTDVELALRPQSLTLLRA